MSESPPVKHLGDEGRDRGSRRLAAVSGVLESAPEVFTLGFVTELPLGLLAGILFYFGHFPLVALGMSVVAAGMTGLACWFIRRAPSPGRRSWSWIGLLWGLCLLQAGAWLYDLAALEAVPGPAMAMGVTGVAVALLPLVYWPTALLLSLLLAAGLAWFLLSPSLAWALAGRGALELVFAAAFAALQRRRRRLAALDREKARVIAELHAESMDARERLRYEQERHSACREELAAVRDLAEQADRAKTEFLATISHEIRTPLNGILPTLEMLQGTALNEEQRRYVRAASSSSRHLLRIIDDLLDFARAESGKLQLESIELDLRELVQSVLDLMQGSADRKGLSLELRWDERLPRIVRGDPIRLRQILANLLSNAIKFTEHGGVRILVEQLDPGRREVAIRFSVIDSGIGLSRDEARNLFSSFTQADASTTRKHGGTGLGLAICRRLVELMGGQIGVRSQLGQGSTFWFELPMRRSAEDVPAARRSLEGLRVLSAVTDRALAARLSQDLAQWGVKEERAAPVEIARRAHDAAALGSSWAFECLLLDSMGEDQRVIPVLRDIQADVLLRKLRVVVLTRSSELAARLHDEFSVYVLDGKYRGESLRRLLDRLFDVARADESNLVQERLSGHFDLNVDQESVLVADGPPPAAGTGSGPRVLLVEDNPVNRGVVERVLAKLGAESVVAENGREALEILDSGENFDLVLMDCQMPVMDGYEATRLWREREGPLGRHLPIVAMTANAMPGDREKCRQAGMDDYLPKPVSIGELRSLLERWSKGEAPETAAVMPGARDPVDPDGDDRRMLDRSILDELREVMGEEFDRLVRTFLDHSPDLMDQLQKAALARKAGEMAAPAHSLKSSAANMGAMKLSALARDLEVAARRGDLEAALTAYRQMPMVFLATCAALRSELGGDQAENRTG